MAEPERKATIDGQATPAEDVVHIGTPGGNRGGTGGSSGPEEPFAESGTSAPGEDAEPKSAKKSWLWRVLDRFEDIEIRMIVGVFRFTFVRVPLFIKDLAVNWFPTLVKFIKVTLLFAFWCLLIVGPVVWLNKDRVGVLFEQPTPMWTWMEAWSTPLPGIEQIRDISTWLWSSVALMGSVWGVLYVRRVRRSRRGAGGRWFGRRRRLPDRAG
jgi:hypothetical protein